MARNSVTGQFEGTFWQDRFWACVDKSDGCWNWLGSVSKKTGYGQISVDRRSVLAHRASFEIANGPIPERMMVLHKCDNRQCVNPEHLYLGTHSDNMRDRKERARTTKGEKAGPVQYPERFKGSNNPASKLTEADVLTIRGRKERGDSYAAIARDYEVSKQAIYLIVKRKNWHWV